MGVDKYHVGGVSCLSVQQAGMLQRRCEPESAAKFAVEPSGPHPTPAIFMHAGKRTCRCVDRAGSSNSDVTLNWSLWRSRSSSRTQVRYLCHRFPSISTVAAAAVHRHIAVQSLRWTRGFRPFSRAVDRPAWRRGRPSARRFHAAARARLPAWQLIHRTGTPAASAAAAMRRARRQFAAACRSTWQHKRTATVR